MTTTYPYGMKPAARMIARANVGPLSPGVLSAMNHLVAGYVVTQDFTKIYPEGDPVRPYYYCAVCGEPVGSVYAKPCCTDDNTIEA